MPTNLRREQCCTVEGCLRPARELGGYCTTCWRGLAPEKRDVLRWQAENGAAGTRRDAPRPRSVSEYAAATDAEARAAADVRAAAFDVVAEAEAILRDAA